MISNGVHIKRIREECYKLGLSDKCMDKVREIRDKFLKKRLLSQSQMVPKTFIAGAIYVASVLKKETRSQSTISASTGVCKASIRKAYKIITEELDL